MNNYDTSADCSNCVFDCFNRHTLSADELKLLIANQRSISYKKGESIFKQDTFVSHIIYLKKGLVKAEVEGFRDKKLIIRFIGSGQFIGFSAISKEDYYPYSTVAIKNAELCIIKKEAVNQLISQNPNVGSLVIDWYSNDYRFQYNKFSILGTKNMPGRLAASLLYLNSSIFQEENIYKYLTRRDIAELSGMSIESMLKLLHELKADKIIQVKGKQITINDIAMLHRLSKIG